MTNQIKSLFANDIYRRIEEVIKVDQTDEGVIRSEIEEYVITKSILGGYTRVLDRYNETPNKPHEGIAIWVSGFFGSGKSSFAKLLGLALANRQIQGKGTAELFAGRSADPKFKVLLNQANERVPTEAVIFDVSSDRGIRSGNQTLTEIVYRLFLKQLGYAEDIDLAELEITLEERGELDGFKATYNELFSQSWDDNKDLIALSLGEASSVMHNLYPERFGAADTWAGTINNRADITPARLAERCKELMSRRRPGKTLVVVVDEVGQFVSHDTQKMLDLQAIVQNFGRIGRGKLWLVVTSQEKLNELVGGLDGKRVELARLMDRFPQETQVHLEPSDISEVTSRRVLAKNAGGEAALRKLFTASSARLSAHTRVSADSTLPELTTERFIDLYPLLPYHVDLIILIVSGLRTQGGATKHVGGANRTIIKLAQQLLIHDGSGLAAAEVGQLVRLDQIYDMVQGNIASEIRSKISEIPSKVRHDYAQKVAKTICLLQFVPTVHRTAENIAACLHPAVDADSVLPQVKEALAKLEAEHQVRKADGQYRIPSPAEDDWETTRASITVKPGDVHRIHARLVAAMWEPTPAHNLAGARVFKAGVVLNGRTLIADDIAINLTLADAGDELAREVAQARTRSQSERSQVFWVAALDAEIDRLTVEIHRANEILERNERLARTKDQTALVTEEKASLAENEGKLKALLRKSLLSGNAFFRGNVRDPDPKATSLGHAASALLAQTLPEVYNRFHDGAAAVTGKDLDALLATDNLRGLPPVFTQLRLLVDLKGQPAIAADAGALKELLDRIDHRASYGEPASGQYLIEEFGKEPYGWSADVIRLFAVCLLRAGAVKVVSGGSTIDSALSVQAKQVFPNNNLFKRCAFQRKTSSVGIEQLIEAESACKDTFGAGLPQLEIAAAAQALRTHCVSLDDLVRLAHELLSRHQLPGADVLTPALDQLRAIRNSNDEDTVTTFVASHKALREAQARAKDLQAALTEPRLLDLARARKALDQQWPVLQQDNPPSSLVTAASELTNLLAKETFFRDLPAIDQAATMIGAAYQVAFDAAASTRTAAYQDAVAQVKADPSFTDLDSVQQDQVLAGLMARAQHKPAANAAIAQVREETASCVVRLSEARAKMAQALEGSRLVTLRASDYFQGRITSHEQLHATLKRLEQDCLKQLGNQKSVLIQ